MSKAPRAAHPGSSGNLGQQVPYRPGYVNAPYGQQVVPPAQNKFAAVIVVVAVGSALIGGVVVAFLAVMFLTPPLSSSKADLERKQLADIKTALDGAAMDRQKQSKLARMRQVAGREFYERAMEEGVIDPDMLGKIVSLTGGDSKAESTAIDPRANVPLEPHNCSYTGPRANELLEVLKKKGDDRTIVITFNARNWNNYEDRGVLVLWSDEAVGTWLTFEEARNVWGITQEEWADPAGKLFGKKAPFQHTYE